MLERLLQQGEGFLSVGPRRRAGGAREFRADGHQARRPHDRRRANRRRSEALEETTAWDGKRTHLLVSPGVWWIHVASCRQPSAFRRRATGSRSARSKQVATLTALSGLVHIPNRGRSDQQNCSHGYNSEFG